MLTAIKRWAQSLIGLSNREANAFVIMVPTMLIVIFSESFYRSVIVKDRTVSIKEVAVLDSAVSKLEVKNKENDPIHYFQFNPNTATKTEFLALGISTPVANRIDQYRQKGGRFSIKSDFAKMYGLDSALYKRLVPYIDLPKQLQKAETYVAVQAPKHIIEFDLNKADTVDFESVKGIGPVLAARIIKFRESLGGFVRITQLKEIFGLDSLVLNELGKFHISQDFQPTQININTANESELDRHPYISGKQAKAIVTYRMQHGLFQSVNDLRKVKFLTQEFISKTEPYLAIE